MIQNRIRNLAYVALIISMIGGVAPLFSAEPDAPVYVAPISMAKPEVPVDVATVRLIGKPATQPAGRMEVDAIEVMAAKSSETTRLARDDRDGLTLKLKEIMKAVKEPRKANLRIVASESQAYDKIVQVFVAAAEAGIPATTLVAERHAQVATSNPASRPNALEVQWRFPAAEQSRLPDSRHALMSGDIAIRPGTRSGQPTLFEIGERGGGVQYDSVDSLQKALKKRRDLLGPNGMVESILCIAPAASAPWGDVLAAAKAAQEAGFKNIGFMPLPDEK